MYCVWEGYLFAWVALSCCCQNEPLPWAVSFRQLFAMTILIGRLQRSCVGYPTLGTHLITSGRSLKDKIYALVKSVIRASAVTATALPMGAYCEDEENLFSFDALRHREQFFKRFEFVGEFIADF